MDSPLPILYEDNHLLVVNKPAGIATQGALAGEASVHGVMSEYLKQRFNKPGNVYLGIVSRLDAVTSGVVVLARTSKAAARLSEQFRDRSVVKQYVAVLAQNVAAKATTGKARAGGQFGSDWQLWQDWLLKDDAAAKMRAVREGTPGAQLARLQCLQLAAHESDLVLAQFALETGRKHQIRVQAANRRWPILGDRKYGGRDWSGPGIALHAVALEIAHPTLKQPLKFVATYPRAWRSLPFVLADEQTLSQPETLASRGGFDDDGDS